jgi:hypothetical protein
VTKPAPREREDFNQAAFRIVQQATKEKKRPAEAGNGVARKKSR